MYTREFPGVYKYLFALCGEQTLAEELTQETFYRAIQNSETFRGTCKLSVWLCQIGKNLYLSQLRRERRRPQISETDQPSHPDPEEALLRHDTAMLLHRRLPKKGFNNTRFQDKILIVNLSQLERVFEAGATVDENTLRAAKLVQGPCDAVKLLGNGTLTKNLNVVVDFVSASAREKVTQAGGTVTVLSEA